MIKAKESFRGVRDGDIYPTQFHAGDELTGNLARDMLNAGLAVDTEKKPPTKGLKGPPRNKHSSLSPVDQASRRKTPKKLSPSKQSRSTQTTK